MWLPNLEAWNNSNPVDMPLKSIDKPTVIPVEWNYKNYIIDRHMKYKIIHDTTKILSKNNRD